MDVGMIVGIGLLALVCWKLDVRRHSPHHVTASLAVGGRGVFLSRTLDGSWWALRLRRRRCRPQPTGPDGAPPASGCREPRHPIPSGPGGGHVALDAPPR